MPLYICTSPGCLYAPILPVHLYLSLYHMCPICHGDFGGHLCTPYVWGLLGASVHVADISVSCQCMHCFSVHRSHTSCCPSLWVASLLDWMPMDVCNASCCCSFLCSIFIISQSSITMATTATPPMTVVHPDTSSLLSMVTMAPSLMGLPVTLGHHDVVLPPPLTLGHLEELLALPLCHSSNLSLRCLFRLMPIMPRVLHR